MNEIVPTDKDRFIAVDLVAESDRGCVIFAAALLDETLEELLRAACRQKPEDIKSSVDPLFKGYAPLATFSSKIDVAFAFGLLPQALHHKIDIIRRLRNDFAHESGSIDFSDHRCAERLKLVIDADCAKRLQEAYLDDAMTTKRLMFVLSVTKMIEEIKALANVARDGNALLEIKAGIEDASGNQANRGFAS